MLVAGNNAVPAVKLLRASSRKMDPLSVLGTAETILTEVNRIGDFVDAVKTNTKKCKALWERVQRLEEIAEGLTTSTTVVKQANRKHNDSCGKRGGNCREILQHKTGNETHIRCPDEGRVC